MNIQIFGTKKNSDSRKAERFFKERGIKYQYVDMKEKGLSPGEFQSVCRAIGGVDTLIDLDFKDKDLHIHIPEGAVPKDGPSAGITMFTAVTSLVTGIRVNPELAMTGEISLRGQVLPIGGLPEKLMAAVRAGIKKVLIPKDNVRDLDEVPKETLEKLEIVPVADVSEVIREALHIWLPKHRTSPFTLKSITKALPAADTQAL